MTGPRPKPEGQRQRRNPTKKPALGKSVIPAKIAAPVAANVPKPTSRWRAVTKSDWKAIWSHPITMAMDRTLHEPQMRRLFDLRDDREVIAAIVRAEPVVEGSQGQSRPHPLMARLGQLESEIRQLEDRNGLSPKSMADLGVSFGAAKKSLDDLAQGIEDDDDQGDFEDEEDPRIIDIQEAPRSRKTT